jgi:enoyl-CoA hydratase/carnithine racemase
MPLTVEIATPFPAVRTLMLNRPERKNALDRATYAALTDALTEAEADASIRVIVLSGAGGNFSSGNDLRDFQDAPANTPTPGGRLLGTLAAAQKPLIAAVEGYAIGIGTTMLLHCDLAYAARDAKFRLPFAALGLSPEGASSYLLPLIAGTKAAAELLMLGEIFSGERAAELGVVNGVTNTGEALQKALEAAKAIAALPAGSILATKMLLKRGHAATITETLATEIRIFAERRASPEAQAAFAAFFSR